MDQAIDFNAYVNQRTGDIEFVERDKVPQHREWKQICVRLKKEGSVHSFAVFENTDNQSVFDCEFLHPTACKVMAETIKFLNHAACQVAFSMPLKEVLSRIVGQDLVHEMWHPIDRLKAEELLREQPVGTFFFRKDTYTAILEEELKGVHGPDIHCLTVTYLENENKVSDLTLVSKKGLWSHYDDDSSLSGKAYPSVEELLDSLKLPLTYPLFT